MRTQKAFTLVEMFVVIVTVAVLLSLILPAGRGKTGGGKMKSSTQARSIVQAMLTHASSNREILPGRDVNGEVPASEIKYSDQGGHSVEGRYAIMLEQQWLGAPVLINPAEIKKTAWSPPSMVTAANYSYALLAIAGPAAMPRSTSWSGGIIGSATPLVCDRLTSTITPNGRNTQSYRSCWSARGQQWLGIVAYGDAHTDFEDDSIIETTRFSDQTCELDDLFFDDTHGDCRGGYNALMIQKGRSTVTP